MKRAVGWLIVAAFLVGWNQMSSAENWPGWRGPRGDGSIQDTQTPTQWSDTENVAWKVELKYGGHSSPVIFGDRVFLVGADTEAKNRMLLAFSRKTGERLWERVVDNSPLEKKHNLNSWASSTPTTDGERIYVSFLHEKEMLAAAYDLDGKELWKVQPGVFSSVHGYCSCPVLFEDLVIINGDHDGAAYLLALKRSTGETVWKTPRENKTRSYCTPLIRNIEGTPHMMLSGSKSVASFDPRTGKRHWVIDGPTEQFVASLVFHEGLVFVTGGFPDKHIMAIDPRGTGNLTKSENIKWHIERNGVSYVPSPVATNGLFFIVSDEGIGTCRDAKTGEVCWQKRIGRHNSASLLTGNDLVYFLDDDGVMRVVKATREYDLVSENRLNEPTYASPAVSQSQFFIRGDKHLFCIGQPDRKTVAK